MNKFNIKSILAPTLVSISILIIVELVSRVILSHIYNRKFDSGLIEEHKYGQSSGLKANATGVVWGKPFHTDDMGGRKPSHPHKGKQKIIVIGDSVTEGVGVDDSSTFANLLNERYESFDVRNISLIGWSVYDYKNALDSILASDTTIKAVHLFYCLNDIYGKTPANALPAMGNKGFLSQINAWLQDKYATYKLIKLLIYQHSDRYFQYDQALYRDDSKVEAAMLGIVSLYGSCAWRRIGFTMHILPYCSQLINLHNDLPQKMLIRKLDQSDIIYDNLLPKLATQTDPNSLYLFADEIHLSARGHKAIADMVDLDQ